jgi:hypothetical protein
MTRKNGVLTETIRVCCRGVPAAGLEEVCQRSLCEGGLKILAMVEMMGKSPECLEYKPGQNISVQAMAFLAELTHTF